MKVIGTVALVTGGNRGIGRAIVESLLGAGAAKVYVGARKPDSANDLKLAYDDRVEILKLDVQSDADVAAAAQAAPDVQLLVNNAGYAAMTASVLDPAADEAYQTEFDINVLGVLRMTRAFAPILKANGGGAVANLNSVASLVNFPLAATYSVSKATAYSVTQAIRNELHAQGTQVVSVHPGPIDTDMAEDVPFEKAPPSVVGEAIIAALKNGTAEIYPDPWAQEFHANYAKDPIAASTQFLDAPAEA